MKKSNFIESVGYVVVSCVIVSAICFACQLCIDTILRKPEVSAEICPTSVIGEQIVSTVTEPSDGYEAYINQYINETIIEFCKYEGYDEIEIVDVTKEDRNNLLLIHLSFDTEDVVTVTIDKEYNGWTWDKADEVWL